MDPETHLHNTPLRTRITSVEEFNVIPTAVYPRETVRTAEGAIEIAGVSLPAVAEEFSTPAFVINEADFRERCRALAVAFGGEERVHYASKAFLTRTVARWVAEEGLALDVASLGELRVALAADFPAQRITVHGNNKSDEFLQTAVTAGAELIVVDSHAEIAALSRVLAQLREQGAVAADFEQDVLVRVTPGVHVDTHEFIATSHEDQKFGFSLASGTASDAAKACIEAAGLRLRGLHCHVGSQVFDAAGFALAAERLLGLWAELLDYLKAVDATAAAEALDTLDLGGGYGIAYTADQRPLDVAAVARDLRARVAAAASAAGVPTPIVNVEPGRAIAGPSMVTLYTVGTIKDVEVSTGTYRRYISVDGGMSDNIRPALYQAEYDCRVANRTLQGKLIPSRVVGSHCESGDILINDVLLPDDLATGDLLVLGATGAYCYSMASRYNMMTRPPVIVASAGSANVMVRRETIEDILALENF